MNPVLAPFPGQQEQEVYGAPKGSVSSISTEAHVPAAPVQEVLGVTYLGGNGAMYSRNAIAVCVLSSY